MYGSTRRACGGRLKAVRAVCADAGEDMPEQAQKETRCASAPWLVSGPLESWRRIKKGGSTCTWVMACGEAACSGCRELLERILGVSRFLAISRLAGRRDGMYIT
jgi:hypothetical protein